MEKTAKILCPTIRPSQPMTDKASVLMASSSVSSKETLENEDILKEHSKKETCVSEVSPRHSPTSHEL